MEYGLRVLGNCLILVDLRDESVKEKFNVVLKRDVFQLFVFLMFWEKVEEYFEDLNGRFNEFMMMSYIVSEEFRGVVFVVVYVDGMIRLQVVRKEINELYYLIIVEFYKKVGIGVVFNMSFNMYGELIVCLFVDVVKMFREVKFDVFVIGKFVVLC